MGFLKKVASKAVDHSSLSTQNNNNNNNTHNNEHNANDNTSNTGDNSGIGGKLLGGVTNKLGGGSKGEKKEGGLDKAVNCVEGHIFNKGSQNNESSVEQAPDNHIASAIRSGYKAVSGKQFPNADK